MKQKLMLIVFVVVLGSILTTALIAVDSFTAPKIKKNKEIKMKKSVLAALGVVFGETDVETVFEKNIKEFVKEEKKFYISGEGNIAFEISGKGLWGPIDCVIAMYPDLETFYGITIKHQEETPGLGSRIGEKEYLDKFRGKKAVPEILITTPGKASTENEVDGISGATMSCDAFEIILNSEIGKNLELIVELKK